MATAQARAKSKAFRTGLVVVTALACLLLIATACGSDASQPKAVPSASPQSTSGLHAIVGRIAIPNLGLDAHLITMGVSADGVMEIPAGVGNVGWYSFSGRPGEGSNIVLVSMRVHYAGAAVFEGLEELEPGDTITLSWEDGREYRYRIISYEVPTDPQARLESVIGSTGQDVITLIGTCGTIDLCPRLIHRAELVS